MSITAKVTSLATQIGNDIQADRAARGVLTTLTTTDKTSIVAAINEVVTSIAASSSINDSVTGASTSWSSTKIDSEISTAVAAVLDSAPAALDTLNELAAALGDNANFATDIATALGLRLRVDAAQSLNGTQQSQGRANIAAASAADVTQLSTDLGTESTFDPLTVYTTARDA